MQGVQEQDRLTAAVLAATSRETQKLLQSEVVLLRPEESILHAALGGWVMRMESKALTHRYVDNAYNTILRFVRYTNEYPWNWTPADLESWTSELLGRISPKSVRGLRGHIGRFIDYMTDPDYVWAEVCEKYFNTFPSQICTEANSISEHAFGDGQRPLTFTREELGRLFDYCDDRIGKARSSGRKGAETAARDGAMFKTQFAWGLRRNELCMLDLIDVQENPREPGFGRVGVLDVRWGKGSKGKGPKQRPVLTVMPWAADMLTQYIDSVRDCFKRAPAMWMTERGQRVSSATYNERFVEYRDALGFSRDLKPHGLRRAYVTYLLEDGWDLRFVQTQVGHSHPSTTTIYSHVSNDFMASTLNSALTDGAPKDLFGAGGA